MDWWVTINQYFVSLVSLTQCHEQSQAERLSFRPRKLHGLQLAAYHTRLHRTDFAHHGLVGDHRLQAIIFGLRDALLFQLHDDFRRHAQDIRRNVIDVHPEQRQQARQRMNSAPIFQVAQHGHCQPVHAVQLFEDREQVEQGLGGMLAYPVASVNDRLAGVFGRQGRSADLGVAQDDHIGIALQGAHRIRQGLAFGDRGVAHFVDRDDAAAQALHRRCK